MNKVQIQQGDVCLERIDKIPEGAIQIKAKPLALGEVTGHSHRIETPNLAEFFEISGTLFVRTKNAVRLVHEEHRPVVLDPGIWRVGIVREYDHFADMERQVQD